jgi:hypothetical protein
MEARHRFALPIRFVHKSQIVVSCDWLAYAGHSQIRRALGWSSGRKSSSLKSELPWMLFFAIQAPFSLDAMGEQMVDCYIFLPARSRYAVRVFEN